MAADADAASANEQSERQVPSLDLGDARHLPLAFRLGMADPIRLHCAIRVGTWIYFVDSLARHGEHGYRRRVREAESLYGATRSAERRIAVIEPPNPEISPIEHGDQGFVTVAGQVMIEAATDSVPPMSAVEGDFFMERWFPVLHAARALVHEGRWALIREHNRALGRG